jgi:hypothetical protein
MTDPDYDDSAAGVIKEIDVLVFASNNNDDCIPQHPARLQMLAFSAESNRGATGTAAPSHSQSVGVRVLRKGLFVMCVLLVAANVARFGVNVTSLEDYTIVDRVMIRADDTSLLEEVEEAQGEKEAKMGGETTILITSNLIPSHPSMRMINETLASCFEHIKGLSPDAPIIIAIDAPRTNKNETIAESDNRRFEHHLRLLVEEYGPRVRIRIPRVNQGLSWNFFHTLKYVETEFIYLIQHDMPFIKGIDHFNLIKSMREYPNDLRIVRFPRQIVGRDNSPCFGMPTKVDHVNGLNFTKTQGWSDKYVLRLL